MASVNQAAPVATPPATPTPPAAPAPVKATRKAGTDLEKFDSVDKAKEAVKDRVKGHRRIFTATRDGKSTVYVASHPAYVGQVEFEKLGGTITEEGKTPKGPKVIGADSIMATLTQMPEAERNKILEQIAALKAAKK